MSDTLVDIVALELDRMLEPVLDVVDDPDMLDQLARSIGRSITDTERTTLLAALTTIASFKAEVEVVLARSDHSLYDVRDLLAISRRTFTAIRALDGVASSLSKFSGFGQDLVARLLTNYLSAWHPLLRGISALFRIQELAEEISPTVPIVENGEIVRPSFSVDQFHFARLASLIRDPAAYLWAEYGNPLATSDDARATADKVFPRLQRVLYELGVSCRYGFHPDDRTILGDAAPFVEQALVIYIEDKLVGAQTEAGIVLTISAADRGDLGLVVSPFGTVTSSRQIESWLLEVALTAGVDLFAYGRHGLTLLVNTETTEVAGTVVATLAKPEQGPAFIFGAAQGTRIEVGGVRLEIGTSLAAGHQSLAILANMLSSALVISPGDGDGFLSSILPADGAKADFDLGLAWSSERGLTLRGSAGLDATFPIGRSLGGLTLSTVNLSLQAHDSSVRAEASATLQVSIGPIRAVIERVGIASALTFPEDGGNLGVADLDLGFKPPTGIGLSVDASVVIGGGFLNFDSKKQEYSGVLELQIVDKIAVKAMGLLTTRLPDSAKGYSLVLLIFAENFTPIQLGLGFVLTGIGGLLSVNRTFSETALRAGLKNHMLDSVLFPKDVVRNAPQIVSNLNPLFPPAKGHHLFGPMAQIAWGTPPLITADVGVVLEFGARQRLLMLAQVVAILPKREHDLVRLQMDAVGVVDFDQGTAELDATLYDSRLLKKFVLTGEMALRLKWEGSPHFALAIGGLHPAFTPPTNFPKLERIAINLTTGENPRLRCEAYFAITANTVQFGARAEFYAAASGFSIQGEIGYDVLIQLDPFVFLADFYAQLQLKRGSRNLFKVRFEGTLAGPRPLHIRGKATFEVLWWDVSIRVDKTLVEGEPPPRAEPIEVMPRLLAAFESQANWVGQLPVGQRPMVTLRGKPEATTDVLLHPIGTLTVKQNVVPLDLDIAKFGSAAPSGARRFSITSVVLGGRPQTPEPVRDFFAPAQFVEMTDDEKLSSPSFESLPAGVSLGSSDFVFTEQLSDRLEVKTIEFETWIVDKKHKFSRPSRPQATKQFYTPSPVRLAQQARFGAAGRSELRRTGRAPYRTTVGKYQVEQERWSIVATENLTEPPTPAPSYSEAKDMLRRLRQTNPEKARGLQLIRFQSEVQAVS